MGFPEHTLNLIRNCVSNCWFSILVNGSPTGFFKSSNGLRQGDPLSPALFILATEALSRGLEKLFTDNSHMFFDTKGGLPVTHLAFADDIIIFSKARKPALKKLMDFLHKYEQISGQTLNHSKSSFVISKRTSQLQLQRIKNITGFHWKQLPIFYLGAPLFKGNKKRLLFENLIWKIRGKICGWEKKFLSHGGRLQLIQSVLSSMPLHLLQVVLPPLMVTEQIEGLFSKFFWGTTETQRKLHWTKWHNISQPREEGGLGVRKFNDVASAFSLKLWWRFRSQSSLWANFLLHKYCGGKFPSMSKVSIHDSPTWKRLCRIQTTAEEHIFWSLGNGVISFWHDHWLHEGSLQDLLHSEVSSPEPVSWYWQQNNWDLSKLSMVLPPYICQIVAATPINYGHKDQPLWKPSADGSFSLKSAWHLIREKGQRQVLYKKLWSPVILPTISIFLWRLLKDWIPTDDRMQRKGFSLASKCWCCEDSETFQHLFFSSCKAKAVWHHFACLFNISLPQTLNVNLFLQAWEITGSKSQDHIRNFIPFLTLWFIWCARNDAKYRGIQMRSQRVICNIYSYLHRLSVCNLWKHSHWKGDRCIAPLLGIPLSKPIKPRPKIVYWVKPSANWFKLNTDGASRGNPGIAGAGGILRNHQGQVIFAFHKSLGVTSNINAELQALQTGLELCLHHGVQNIWIEVDATAIISLIASTRSCHWLSYHTVLKIKAMLDQLETKVSHIFREANQAADLLASQAIDVQGFHFITPDHIQGKLLGITKLDSMGYPYFRFN